MVDVLTLKLRRFGTMTQADEALLAGLGTRSIVPKGADMVRQGDRPKHSTLLLSGLAARYNLTAKGARQMTSLHIEGDFVDLHSLFLKPMDHGILALTECEIASVSHADLESVMNQSWQLTRLMWLSTLVDAAIHRAWLVRMGRLHAKPSLAHLICELLMRYRAIGRAEDQRFNLSVVQSELADILGISTVHVNRSLQDLRADKLVQWENGVVTVLDWDRLRRMAEFDPAYLRPDPIG